MFTACYVRQEIGDLKMEISKLSGDNEAVKQV